MLVTGASSGIGAATARELASRGARTLLVARSADTLERMASELDGAEAFPADVGDRDAVAELAREVTERVGTPDVLVNNAGAGQFLFLEETEPDQLEQMTAVPYLAAAYVTRAFVGAMRERGSGWIVNVNSPVSRVAWPGATGYAAARWALRGLTMALRNDLRATAIGVSEVVPAKVASDYFEHNPGAEQRIPKLARLLRTLEPEQVAGAIADAIRDERRELLLPVELRALALSAQLAPRLAHWLAWRTGARLG